MSYQCIFKGFNDKVFYFTREADAFAERLSINIITTGSIQDDNKSENNPHSSEIVSFLIESHSNLNGALLRQLG